MSIDWRKNEIEIETDDGTATYKFAGVCQWHDCDNRTFQCTSHPIRADVDLGSRIAVYVKTSGKEPAAVYCQDCYLIANPHIAETMLAGEVAKRQDDAQTEVLREMTAALGGIRGL